MKISSFLFVSCVFLGQGASVTLRSASAACDVVEAPTSDVPDPAGLIDDQMPLEDFADEDDTGVMDLDMEDLDDLDINEPPTQRRSR